jgi:hypothetical protein
MAKKTPWESQKPVSNKGSHTKKKDSVVKTPETAPVVVTKAAEVPPEPAAAPVAPAVRIIKKKVRYVRERKKKEPETTDAAVTPRSKTAAQRIMSKNVPVAPKEDAAEGPMFGPKRKQ